MARDRTRGIVVAGGRGSSGLATRWIIVWLCLILGAVGAKAGSLDTDGDGVFDVDDNCSSNPNPNQCDSDQDGYGNICDGDFDQNGIVDASDFPIFIARHATAVDSGKNEDMDCNCCVNANDFDGYFLPQISQGFPGPSGRACQGTPGCSPLPPPFCLIPRCGLPSVAPVAIAIVSGPALPVGDRFDLVLLGMLIAAYAVWSLRRSAAAGHGATGAR
jgi:hypothetical protein